jgi:hypothetical protein
MATPKNALKLLFCLVLATSASQAKNYYITPSGNTSNDGSSFSKPMQLQKALGLAAAGDSIILQGGTYPIPYTAGAKNTIKLDKAGQSGKPIVFTSYQNSKAIIDFSFPEHQWVQSSYGFDLTGSYWYFKGLTITNAGYQGVYVSGAYNTFNNCVFSYCRFSGLEINKGGSYTTVINCDSYRNYDPKNGGGSADGFAPKQTMGVGNVLIGCRAWENSDDGYDTFGDINTPNVFVIIENCWAFSNGTIKIGSITYSGNSDGFKLGGNYVPQQNQAYNCIAFGNALRGFDENHNVGSVKVYNCLGYNNGANFSFGGALNSGEQHDFRNNISLKEVTATNIKSTNKQTNNTWNSGFTVTASDFKSVDVSLATIARNPDGSIPETDLFRLKAGSKLIDAGTTTGRPYLGSKPDIGPFEYNSTITDLFDAPNYANNTVVFPTVTSDEITVRFLGTFSDSKVSIYSVEGVLMYTGSLNGQEEHINCRDLANGKYIVKVENDGQIGTFKMIKR